MRLRISFENHWGWRGVQGGWHWFPGSNVPLLGIDLVVDPDIGFSIQLAGFGFSAWLEPRRKEVPRG